MSKKIVISLILVILIILAALFLFAIQTPSDADYVAKDTWPTVDSSGDEEVLIHWQRYVWGGGMHDRNAKPPTFPSPKWRPDIRGDPQHMRVSGPYFKNGHWFYLYPVTMTLHHSATKEHYDTNP